MFVVGEVREFSTGTFVGVDLAGKPGGSFAQLVTERRVWTGSHWALPETPEAQRAYRDFHSTVKL